MKQISCADAWRLVHGGKEIAILDVREPGQFIEAHLLFATPMPYSTLELNVEPLVPNKDVPVILVDAGDDVSGRAEQRLSSMGYANVMQLRGGMPVWIAEGMPVYKGVNVPSKVLGELAETIWHPAMMTPDDLKAKLDIGADIGFYDVRPAHEYAKMRIPGADCLPNGEIAHRIGQINTDAGEQPVVLTCAGRTRGIIGAIGLMLSGHEGPVHALENGTQGWALSGFDLERGNSATPLPVLDARARDISFQRGAAMCARFDLEQIDADKAARLLSDGKQTTYLFDLRTPEESNDAPLHGARVVPGVQLVQATDQFVGVRHARMILACDTGLRSTIAAFWLRQLGFDVCVAVLDTWSNWPEFARDFEHWCSPDMETIAAGDITDDDILLDVRPSADFRACHVVTAQWAIRPFVPQIVQSHGNQRIVLFDDGSSRAQLCALDALATGHENVAVVEGGHGALVGKGHVTVSTPDIPPDAQAIDFPLFVHDRHDGNMEASRQYLAWETGLVAQLSPDERNAFHLTTP